MSDECSERPGQKAHSYEAEQIVFPQVGLSPAPVVLTEHLCTGMSAAFTCHADPLAFTLCPGAWLHCARTEEAVPGQRSEQPAHASTLQTSPVCPASLEGRERFPSGIPAGLETVVPYPR